MKKEFRLKNSTDFRRVFKEGKKFLSSRFVLYMRKNNLPQARLGVSISKGHFNLATRRNRLRRLVKELFKKQARCRFKGYDFVIASRTGCPNSHFNEAIEELHCLIVKLKG